MLNQRKDDEEKELLVESDAVAGIVETISLRGISLEEAEEAAGATKDCIMKAISENGMIDGTDYYLLCQFLM
jgi:hypothetical protein